MTAYVAKQYNADEFMYDFYDADEESNSSDTGSSSIRESSLPTDASNESQQGFGASPVETIHSVSAITKESDSDEGFKDLYNRVETPISLLAKSDDRRSVPIVRNRKRNTKLSNEFIFPGLHDGDHLLAVENSKVPRAITEDNRSGKRTKDFVREIAGRYKDDQDLNFRVTPKAAVGKLMAASEAKEVSNLQSLTTKWAQRNVRIARKISQVPTHNIVQFMNEDNTRNLLTSHSGARLPTWYIKYPWDL